MTDVLWYIHNHGRGHSRRFERIAPNLESSVVTMGSLDRPSGSHRHVRLERDNDGSVIDLTANGRLHYAPLLGEGLQRRHARIARVVEQMRPSLAVVDVSVEVGVFLRLMGVPVVAVRQPGMRSDHAHSLLYDVAAEVLAPWPEEWDVAVDPPDTQYLGLPAVPAPEAVQRDWSVAIVIGGGQSPINHYMVEAIAASVPGMIVRVAGLTGRSRGNVEYLGQVDDVPALMARSTVVVGGAGLNTVAEVATTRTPFVCVPGSRPFDEQHFTAGALDRFGAAVVDRRPDLCTDWGELICRAIDLDPDAMQRFVAPDGWRAAAGIVDRAIRATRSKVAP